MCCIICSAESYLIKDNKKDFKYYRCSSCGFIALDEEHRVDSRREKEQYDQHNNGFNDTGYVEMFERFIDKYIVPYLSNIETALDFGSGPGPVLYRLLEERGLEVDIYDLYYSPKKVYEDRSYDLITSTEVFEHLSQPMKILEELVNHLNSNSYLILMTKFPPKDDKEFLNWWYRRDPTHISFFTPKSFEIMAKKVNLEVLKIIDDNVVVFQKC